MTTSATATAHTAPNPRLVWDGRRRLSPVLTAQRRARSIRLVGVGQTYQHVAAGLGYESRGTVHESVHRALQAE